MATEIDTTTVTGSAKAVPYVAFNAFESFLGTLKKLSTVPATIAKDMMDGMSGGTQGHLFTAMKALHLIDDNGRSKPMLATLVEAYDTERWKDTLGTFIKEEYADILCDLDIETASQSQLRKQFADQSSAVKDKAIRFYLNALKAAEVEFSPMLTKRKPRTRAAKPKVANGGGGVDRKPPPDPEEEAERETFTTPIGMIDFPIPLGEKMGVIRVPASLTAEQFPMVEAMLNAVKVFSQSNSNNARGRRESTSNAT